MEKLFLLFTAISFLGLFNLNAQNQMGSIQGRVTDDVTGESLPFANVAVLNDSLQKIATTSTDFDGNYNFPNIEAGIYMLEVSYVGYPKLQETGVILKIGQTLKVNLVYPEESSNGIAMLDENIVVIAHRIPLIEQDNTTGGQILTAKDIKHMPTRNVRSIAATMGSVNQHDAGEELSGSGRRQSSNDVYIDGVRVVGNFGIPETEIKQIKIRSKKIGKSKAKKAVADGPIKAPKGGETGLVENAYIFTEKEEFSTFSIDVDRAAYSNTRKQLSSSLTPAKESVRIEEFINYFDYDYPQPKDEHPFEVITELSECPWNDKAKLVHIGLQGQKVDLAEAPANNLVFLIDVSGSMQDDLKLIQESMDVLIGQLRPEDRVSIVVYAGAAGEVLPSTSGSNKTAIKDALNDLQAGGSTAGGAGILLAYKTAQENFIKDGNNRIILATDGDFNVGASSNQSLEELIVEKRKEGVFLTVLGFGSGNYQDTKMEILADKGNGNYAYIDKLEEAKKVLGKELGGTLLTIAKDVKIQVEFDKSAVLSYRLVGYENRILDKKDFKNDKKDAGELGASHSVTALYEVRLKENVSAKDQLMTVHLRYKQPKGTKSIPLERQANCDFKELGESSDNFRFSAAVAGWGMLLRDSKYKNNLNYDKILKLANGAHQEKAIRKEFISLVQKSNDLAVEAKR